MPVAEAQPCQGQGVASRVGPPLFERAVACCAGGDPEHAVAIRVAILGAQEVIGRFLGHPEQSIRLASAELAGAFEEMPADLAAGAAARYFEEADRDVRWQLFTSIAGTRASLRDWPEFLERAAAKETAAANVFEIRCVQVEEAGSAAPDELVERLMASYVAQSSRFGRFWGALSGLDEDRRIQAVLQALPGLSVPDDALDAAVALLRQVFGDTRVGWHRRRKIRQAVENPEKTPDGKIAKTDFWGVKAEDAPPIPERWNDRQQKVLAALVEQDRVWKIQTNLWNLFGLPPTRDGLRTFLHSRRG